MVVLTMSVAPARSQDELLVVVLLELPFRLWKQTMLRRRPSFQR